jgi:DNA-binding NarL/FixJ family response regulator
MTNILLVDDHQLVIDGYRSMLSAQEAFLVCGEAINGQQALDMVNANPELYHLIITDVTMPVMGGIELCKRIKSKFSHIKVIVLSMHNNISIVKDALNAEADGYVLKNIGQDEFLAAIERVMEEGSYFSQEILPIILNQYKKTNNPVNQNPLSQREREVLELIIQELTSKEIADKLFISKQTVDTHRMNIMQKTGCKSLVGLIKYSIQTGIIK